VTSGRVGEIVTGPIFLTLVGLGFQVSDFHSNQVALAMFAVALAWLAINLSPLQRRIPQLIVRGSMDSEQRDAEKRSADLRDGLRRPAAEGDYRAALREVARLLYTNENLYAQSQGGQEVEDSAVWRDSAPRAWGDALYERLGLPPEAEYR
jgi:hypothetical protein